MKKYESTDAEGYLLAQWWAEITVDGSREKLFAPPSSLGRTIGYFENDDVHLIYERDERGIWFAMWFVPMFAGMSASTWCRRDKRGRKSHLQAIERGYEIGLTVVPVLVGVTTQRELLREHERLGYTIVGMVPHLVDGQDAWIVALTREGWQTRKARRFERREAVVG